MPSNDSHNTPGSSSKTSGSYASRPASAGGSSAYARMMQHHAQQLQQEQQQQIRPAMPAGFNVVEAQALLDHRWTDICQQGLQPTCTCKEEAAAEDAAAAAGAAAGGEELAGKHGSKFLQELKAAADSRTADGAWDDP